MKNHVTMTHDHHGMYEVRVNGLLMLRTNCLDEATSFFAKQ